MEQINVNKMVRIGEMVRKEVMRDMVAKKVNEKVALRNREFKEIPWTIEELKVLNGKALRPSALDSIERHAWKLEDVFRISRTRTNKKHEFLESLHVELEDGTNIMIMSMESTYVWEVGDMSEIE